MHSGLRFANPRSYNLPPSSLITRSICLYSGAALVITQQEWPSKDRTISITGSKRILETRGRIQLDTHRCPDCSKSHLFQPRLIIIALARMASDRPAVRGHVRTCTRTFADRTLGVSVGDSLTMQSCIFFLQCVLKFLQTKEALNTNTERQQHSTLCLRPELHLNGLRFAFARSWPFP